jgi:hypothetical protein
MVLDNPIFINHRKIHLLKKLVRGALVLFLGFFAVPFWAIYNAYFPPARNLIHVNPIAAIIFLLCDTVFSLTLLVLFVYPFFITLGPSKSDSIQGNRTSENLLRRVMRRNLLLSGTMMLSTFATMVFSAYADTFCDGLPRIDNLDSQYFRDLTQVAITLDIFVNSICAHSIGTSFWVPRVVRRFFSRQSQTADETQEYTDKSHRSLVMNSPAPELCSTYNSL